MTKSRDLMALGEGQAAQLVRGRGLEFELVQELELRLVLAWMRFRNPWQQEFFTQRSLKLIMEQN